MKRSLGFGLLLMLGCTPSAAPAPAEAARTDPPVAAPVADAETPAVVADAALPSASTTAPSATAPRLPTNETIDLGGGVVLSRGRTFEFSKAKIVFESGKPTLKETSLPPIERVAKFLTGAGAGFRVEVGAHSDGLGSQEFNLALTQARAEAVKKVMVDWGVSADRIQAVGYAETRPIATNDTEENRERNRRVEIIVLGAP